MITVNETGSNPLCGTSRLFRAQPPYTLNTLRILFVTSFSECMNTKYILIAPT